MNCESGNDGNSSISLQERLHFLLRFQANGGAEIARQARGRHEASAYRETRTRGAARNIPSSHAWLAFTRFLAFAKKKKKKRSRLPLHQKCKNHVKVNILPQWLLFWAGPHKWPSQAELLFGPGPEFQRQCHLLPDPRMSPIVEKKDKFMQREGVSAVKCKLFKLEILCCFCLN